MRRRHIESPGRDRPEGRRSSDSPSPAYETSLPEGVQAVLYKPFKGDFDQMVARRRIRVGVTFNRTFCFADKGVQRGMAYEFGKAFEDQLNQKLKTGNKKINVVFIPMPRDALGSALIDGKVDLVIAQVSVLSLSCGQLSLKNSFGALQFPTPPWRKIPPGAIDEVLNHSDA